MVWEGIGILDEDSGLTVRGDLCYYIRRLKRGLNGKREGRLRKWVNNFKWFKGIKNGGSKILLWFYFLDGQYLEDVMNCF